MHESESGTCRPSLPRSKAVLVAAGLGRLIANAIALARIERAVVRARISRMLPLLASRCIQLGAVLPAEAGVVRLSVIPPSPGNPAALQRALRVFLVDIETVALLAGHAGDNATIGLLRDLRAEVVDLLRASGRSAGGG